MVLLPKQEDLSLAEGSAPDRRVPSRAALNGAYDPPGSEGPAPQSEPTPLGERGGSRDLSLGTEPCPLDRDPLTVAHDAPSGGLPEP